MFCIQIVTAAILALKPQWTEAKIKTYANPICIESENKNIDPLIVVALIQHETGFSASSIYHNKNGSKDYGLMQFNCPSDDKYSQIHMAFRKYWCHSSRRKYLMTVEGNIKAGLAELDAWRSIAVTKHGSSGFLYYTISNKNYKIFDMEFNIQKVCRDCFTVSSSPLIYTNLNTKWKIKNILSEHWWIQHYNWGSKNYSIGVLYIYKVLLERRTANYPVIRKSWHRVFAKNGSLKSCITKDDMCLSKFPERWR